MLHPFVLQSQTMKQIVFTFLLIIGMGTMSACNTGDEHFRAGTWELEGWMENEGDPAKIEPQTHSASVSAQLARMEPRVVAFTEFYRGSNPANVTFKGGVISGHIDHPRQAPFPAHVQEVSGWYREDAFEMRIKLPQMGPYQPYQVVRGERVGE